MLVPDSSRGEMQSPSDPLFLEEVDFSTLARYSQVAHLPSWILNSFIEAVDSHQPKPGDATETLNIEHVAAELLEQVSALLFSFDGGKQHRSSVPDEHSALSELHIIASPDTEHAVFHPPTLTLFRANALAAAILAGCKDNVPVDALAIQYRVPGEAIRGLIDRLSKSLVSRSPVRIPNEVPGSLRKLVLMTSNVCNMRCRYCYADGGSYGREVSRMSSDVIHGAIDQIWEHYPTVNTLMFFGGEPTLNAEAIESTCEYLSTLLANGAITNLPLWGLVTNGLSLSQHALDLIEHYRLVVTVSLDGSPEINNSLRLTRDGVGAFRRIAANIRRIQQATQGKEPSKIEVTYTGAHQRAGIRMLDLVDYFEREFGIKDIHIAPVILNTGHHLAWDPSDSTDELDDMTRAVIGGWQAGSRKQTQLVTACLHALITRSASPYFCGAGLNELTVFPNGDVFPCYMFPYDTFRMGNVLNGHIFDSDSFRAVQERFRANDMKQHSQCQQCWARSFCHVCLGASYAADQTIMNVPSSACALNQIIAKAVLLGLCHVSAEPDAWKRLCQNIATMADENVTKHLRYWI